MALPVFETMAEMLEVRSREVLEEMFTPVPSPFEEKALPRIGNNARPTMINLFGHYALMQRMALVNGRRLCSYELGLENRALAGRIKLISAGKSSAPYWEGLDREEAVQLLINCYIKDHFRALIEGTLFSREAFGE